MKFASNGAQNQALEGSAFEEPIYVTDKKGGLILGLGIQVQEVDSVNSLVHYEDWRKKWVSA